ncbi:helix-turn-helix domain-containing protein [Pricia sp. S334]|uniref:Helix-turn-helix domain-containing protein n=1 Tax=Pricia mediterranea TaxID=3076079 RepID=A0ABU3L725_9FLAO|nr:helix-turn-helix domain-containing protein [Pricia sp. S334]MDT7829555.1 helix-turn-helix domain-containing protein [Pricia sp. S334]
MKSESVKISPILKNISSAKNSTCFTVCWIKSTVATIEIDRTPYSNVSNTIFFLDPKFHWSISKKDNNGSSGYLLSLPRTLLNNPILSKLHINTVRVFSSGEIPLFKLSPTIEKRTQAILEMIDELLGSDLNHKDDAILALLKTFFVYCDGQCNIKSNLSNENAKANLVYKFKQLVNKYLFEHHDVTSYANLLHVSPRYLNECVQDILTVSAKAIIIEQLMMRSRHALKFSDKTLKEISFELGFSSPDYFSQFFKTHTGFAPSTLRKG